MKITTGPQCQKYFDTGKACPGCEQCAPLPVQAQSDDDIEHDIESTTTVMARDYPEPAEAQSVAGRVRHPITVQDFGPGGERAYADWLEAQPVDAPKSKVRAMWTSKFTNSETGIPFALATYDRASLDVLAKELLGNDDLAPALVYHVATLPMAEYEAMAGKVQAQPVAGDEVMFVVKQDHPKVIWTISADGALTLGDHVTPRDVADSIKAEWDKMHRPAAASESVESPEFSELIAQLKKYPSLSAPVDDLIAHIHAWHAANVAAIEKAHHRAMVRTEIDSRHAGFNEGQEAANKPAAPAAMSDERIMALYDEAIGKGGSADNIILNTVKAALAASAAQPVAEPVGTVCDVGEGFAALDLTGEVKIGDAVYLAAPAAPTTKEG